MLTSPLSLSPPVAIKSMRRLRRVMEQDSLQAVVALAHYLSVLISPLRTEASADKGKNGHLNPAFHLKVVGPINKAGGLKGVSGECVCAVARKGGKKGRRGSK